MRISKMVVFLVLLMVAGGVFAAEEPSSHAGESLLEAMWDVIAHAFDEVVWADRAAAVEESAESAHRPGFELGASFAWIDPVGLTSGGDPAALSEQEGSEGADEPDGD